MSDQTKKPDKTDWHRLWGLMMSPVFKRLGCETTVEMDLSSKSQRLDMAVVTKTEKPLYDELDPVYYEGFENLNRHNLISFKSFHEVFNVTALEEFYGYFTSYRKEKDIKLRGKAFQSPVRDGLFIAARIPRLSSPVGRPVSRSGCNRPLPRGFMSFFIAGYKQAVPSGTPECFPLT